MKVTRNGSKANYGQSHIELNSPKITWVKSDSTISIRQSNIQDFSTNAHHNYNIRINTEELKQILKTISLAAKEDPVFFEAEFESSLKVILQLQYVLSGHYK